MYKNNINKKTWRYVHSSLSLLQNDRKASWCQRISTKKTQLKQIITYEDELKDEIIIRTKTNGNVKIYSIIK